MGSPLFDEVALEEGMPPDSPETEEYKKQLQWNRLGKILRGEETPVIADLPWLEEVFQHEKAQIELLMQIMKPLYDAVQANALGGPPTAQQISVEVGPDFAMVVVTPESGGEPRVGVIPNPAGPYADANDEITITPDSSIDHVDPWPDDEDPPAAYVEPELDTNAVIKSAAANVKAAAKKTTKKAPAKKAAKKAPAKRTTAKKASDES